MKPTNFMKMLEGTATFDNEKQVDVAFPDGGFTGKPTSIQLTIAGDATENNSSPEAHSVTVAGFTIKTKKNYTGDVMWLAIGPAGESS